MTLIIHYLFLCLFLSVYLSSQKMFSLSVCVSLFLSPSFSKSFYLNLYLGRKLQFSSAFLSSFSLLHCLSLSSHFLMYMFHSFSHFHFPCASFFSIHFSSTIPSLRFHFFLPSIIHPNSHSNYCFLSFSISVFVCVCACVCEPFSPLFLLP